MYQFTRKDGVRQIIQQCGKKYYQRRNDDEEKSIYGYRPKHEFQLFADDKTNAKYYEEKAAVMALAEIKFSFVVGIDCYAGELSFKKVNKNER